jgi:membrane protease YdiL (CAAX protease family)
MKSGGALLDRMSRSAAGSGRVVELSPPGRGEPATHIAPSRYKVREDADGKVLVCTEAPTVRVCIQRGQAVTAAAARSAPSGSIFLDGAAQGEPFMDAQRAVYNLDHHEGCVRAFTLATCEQAIVLLRKGLDLRKRDWTVHANDADLDTILAIWVLLNHLRLTGADATARTQVMPLLRLEGVIDAHGLDLQDLTALPSEVLQDTQRRMQRLLGRERSLKSTGLWGKIDLLEYVADRLRAVDAFVYPPEQFEDLEEVEELARVDLTDRSIVVACRAAAGIYEVERQLRRYHGDRLGMILLQKNPETWSLRLVDPTLPASLDDVYEKLNLVDPAAGGSRSPNRWGGSEEIGGSPRSTGTRLPLRCITEACRRAFQAPTPGQRLARMASSALVAIGCMALAFAGVPAASRLAAATPLADLPPALAFGSVVAALCGAFLRLRGRRAPGIFGLRRPSGLAWWSLLPVALTGALAGGVWVPPVALPAGAAPDATWLSLLAVPLLPASAELLFRGVVHGRLAWSFPVQRATGSWFVSWPAIVSSALYAPWAVLLASASVSALPATGFPWNSPVAGALLFGLAVAMVRERSESVFAAVLVHWTCVAAVLAASILRV